MRRRSEGIERGAGARRGAVAVGLAALVAACATSDAGRRGREAEERLDWDDPDRRELRVLADRLEPLVGSATETIDWVEEGAPREQEACRLADGLLGRGRAGEAFEVAGACLHRRLREVLDGEGVPRRDAARLARAVARMHRAAGGRIASQATSLALLLRTPMSEAARDRLAPYRTQLRGRLQKLWGMNATLVGVARRLGKASGAPGEARLVAARLALMHGDCDGARAVARAAEEGEGGPATRLAAALCVAAEEPPCGEGVDVPLSEAASARGRHRLGRAASIARARMAVGCGLRGEPDVAPFAGEDASTGASRSGLARAASALRDAAPWLVPGGELLSPERIPEPDGPRARAQTLSLLASSAATGRGDVSERLKGLRTDVLERVRHGDGAADASWMLLDVLGRLVDRGDASAGMVVLRTWLTESPSLVRALVRDGLGRLAAWALRERGLCEAADEGGPTAELCSLLPELLDETARNVADAGLAFVEGRSVRAALGDPSGWLRRLRRTGRLALRAAVASPERVEAIDGWLWNEVGLGAAFRLVEEALEATGPEPAAGAVLGEVALGALERSEGGGDRLQLELTPAQLLGMAGTVAARAGNEAVLDDLRERGTDRLEARLASSPAELPSRLAVAVALLTRLGEPDEAARGRVAEVLERVLERRRLSVPGEPDRWLGRLCAHAALLDPEPADPDAARRCGRRHPGDRGAVLVAVAAAARSGARDEAIRWLERLGWMDDAAGAPSGARAVRTHWLRGLRDEPDEGDGSPGEASEKAPEDDASRGAGGAAEEDAGGEAGSERSTDGGLRARATSWLRELDAAHGLWERVRETRAGRLAQRLTALVEARFDELEGTGDPTGRRLHRIQQSSLSFGAGVDASGRPILQLRVELLDRYLPVRPDWPPTAE